MAVGRPQVMATLQAAQALELGVPMDSPDSWGLNPPIFCAAAKRGFRGRRPWTMFAALSGGDLLSGNEFLPMVYGPKGDEIAAKWTKLSDRAIKPPDIKAPVRRSR